jgi:hypothetical protein
MSTIQLLVVLITLLFFFEMREKRGRVFFSSSFSSLFLLSLSLLPSTPFSFFFFLKESALVKNKEQKAVGERFWRCGTERERQRAR